MGEGLLERKTQEDREGWVPFPYSLPVVFEDSVWVRARCGLQKQGHNFQGVFSTGRRGVREEWLGHG